MASLQIRMHRIQKRPRRILQQLRQQGLQWLQQFNFQQQATQKSDNRRKLMHNGSFHQAIAPVLIMAQCFCLMPVCGVCAASVHGLNFSWYSWRTWYSILFICSTSLDTLFSINYAVHSKLDVRNVEPMVFHVSILLGSYRFLQLARKWPALMQHWATVEQQLPKYETWSQRQHQARRIRYVAFVLISLALIEHSLSIASAVYYDYCPLRRDPIESYLYGASLQLFYVFPYSNWLAWLGKIQNLLITFAWSYIDIFVMIIGIGLSQLLSRLTSHLRQLAQRPMSEAFWTYTRTRYSSIVELIIDMDDAVSGLMLISFGSNLYFVCLQLLKSINKRPSIVQTIYFYFSLSFLISRSVAVILFVSSVNDRSREPVRLLRLVPPGAYHGEVSRFASELSADNIALSGLKFFNITRKLFLTVAGSIVTYELVLIQFHEDEKSWDCETQMPLN